MEKITSTSNSKIMLYSKLNQKKYRDEYNMFLLENYKLIVEALERNEKIETIIIREDFEQKYKEIILKENNRVLIVPNNVFAKISDTVTSQGIIAVASKKEPVPLSKIKGKTLVLDRIQDAGNVGTLIRSALGFGFENVILLDSVDIYSPKVVRSSGGGIFSLNFIAIQEKELIFYINNSNFAIFIADMYGENLYKLKNTPNNLMLIVGNEGQGVSNNLKALATHTLSIPMSSNLESLNAGVSGSIIMSYISEISK